jgi:Tfp pilus assembly protein PilX
MASILKVDNIGKTSGSTQDTMAGLAKSWIDLDGSGTISTRDSFNIGSTTDNGTGSYSPTFTNNMGSANYSTPSSVANADDAGAFNALGIVTKATTTYRIDAESSSSNNDAARLDVAVLGDLA